MKLSHGLYEQLLTEGLMLALSRVDPRVIHKAALHQAEAPNRIAFHLGRQIESAIASIPEKERVSVGIQVARALLTKLGEMTGIDDSTEEMPILSGEVLHSIMRLLPDSTPKFIDPLSFRFSTRLCSRMRQENLELATNSQRKFNQRRGLIF